MSWAEAVSNLFKNPLAYVCLGILIVVGLVLVKKGVLKIHTGAVTLGDDEKERMILRVQLTSLHAACDGMVQQLPKNLNPWRTKYVLAKVSDVLEEAALYNHIHKGDRKYYEIKEKLVYNTVMKRVEDPWFMTEEFKGLCYKFVDDMLDEFIAIRESYSKM